MEGLVPAPNKEPKPIKVNIDLTNEKVDLDEMLSCKKRAKFLRWHEDDIRLADSLTGVYDNFPLVCKASECPFSHRCEVPEAAREQYFNTPCVVERARAFQLFAAYVEELKVTPSCTTDLNSIGNLIKLNLMIRRMEIQLSDERMTEEIISVYSKTQVKSRTINILLSELRACRKEVEEIYATLLLSRNTRFEAELKKNAAEGKSMKNEAELLNSIQERIKQQQRAMKTTLEEEGCTPIPEERSNEHEKLNEQSV